MNYYIADLHIFHNNVLKNGRFHEREFETMDEMLHEIERRWNETVTNADHVYLLGDVGCRCSADQIVQFVSRLRGDITLVCGNHDNSVKKDQRFRRLFAEVCDYKEICDHANGKAVNTVLCHYPMYSWHLQFRGAVHLYGHVHNNEDERMYQDAVRTAEAYFRKRDSGRQIEFRAYNVGCMMPYMDFTPRTLEYILNNADNREK